MTIFLHRFGALLQKELIFLLKNPKTRFTLLLPPVIQLMVLGYAATMDLKQIRFAVLDESRSFHSRLLLAKFKGNRIFYEEPPLLSYDDMKSRIDRRKIKMALVIPTDFERQLQEGGQPVLQVLLDARNSTTAGLAIGYAENVIDAFNRDVLGKKTTLKIQSRAWFNQNYSAQYFMIPALLATIALLDLMLLSSLSFAREREDGTFDQLMLTPYSTAELLIAKGIACMVVGFCQLTLGLLAARLWFQIPFVSSYWLLYGMFASFMFASVGIGLLVSVHCKDLEQAMLGTFLIAIPFAMLSGMVTPIESMPDFFQKITLLNPLRYGIKSLHSLFLEGVGFSELSKTFAMLWGIGSGGFILAYISFRYQRER